MPGKKVENIRLTHNELEVLASVVENELDRMADEGKEDSEDFYILDTIYGKL